MTLNRLQKNNRPYALYSFLWALFLAALIVTPIMIYDNGYFLYYGDFNVQEIPFYQLAHDAVRSGELGWSHTTDLGANFIGSYSFYLLGSPFFWLTVLLPSSWVAYAIGPLLALKLSCASLAAYTYLRRYVRDRRYAVVGGILYAFSSFSIYNIFFFHFHEPMIAFPLLLAALDEFHATKRRGVVALAVFFAATVNYYFFVGQVVFTIIYYIVKMIMKAYRFRIKEFLLLAVECVLGLCLSFFLLLPSIAAIAGNSRLSEIVNGWSVLVYSYPQRYIQIIVSMFFPGDVPAKNNFTPSAGGKWSSVAAYLPMFSMTFVIGYLRQKKNGVFRRILLILLLMALVPGLNTIFQLLNNCFYLRWFYILTLMMTAVTVRSLETLDDVDFKRGFIPTVVFTLLITALIGFIPQKITDGDDAGTYKVGLYQTTTDFWIMVILAVFGLLLTLLVYWVYRKRPKYFLRTAVILLSLFVVFYSETYLWVARKYANRDDKFMMSYALNRGADITLGDIKQVRSDFYDTSDNMGMFWQVPNIQAFHSVVPGSLMDFYNRTGVQRDVASRPSADLFGLRGLLSVKYLFTEDSEDPDIPTSDLMPGFRYLRTENGFHIYENDYYVPMGFTYRQFITEEEYSDIAENIRHLTLMQAMVLTQEQMKRYADITGYTDGMYDSMNRSRETEGKQSAYFPRYEGYNSITESFHYDDNGYKEDAVILRKHSCTSFDYTDDGFEASFNNQDDDNLLFFSIPYDEGWTAYVNGERTDIEKVNIGFMAVRVPGHTVSEIEFRYQTPLLKEGCIGSAIALSALIIYLILCGGMRSKRPFRRKYTIKQKSEPRRSQ